MGLDVRSKIATICIKEYILGIEMENRDLLGKYRKSNEGLLDIL